MPVLVTKRPTPVIVITGPDFEPLGGLDREPVSERRAYWREIAHEAYLLKLKELNKGIDVDGQPLTPRKKPRRDSATGPVLSPHWSGSRFESELQWHVRGDREAVLTWKQPFARIVSYHADPQGGHLPRRDVVGLTSRSQAKLKAHGDRWWTARINKGRRGAAARTTLGTFEPVGQVVVRKEITHTRRVKPRPAHVAAPEIAGPKPAYKLVQDLGPIWEAAGLKRTTVTEIAETVRRLEATQSGPTLTELARRLGITRPIAGKPEAVRLIERNLKERLRSGPELPPPPARRPPPPVPAPKPAPPPKPNPPTFGPSRIDVRLGQAEEEAGVLDLARKLLTRPGRKSPDVTLRDLASLAGAPDWGRLVVGANHNSTAIILSLMRNDFLDLQARLSRETGQAAVHLVSVRVAEEVDGTRVQGTGLGAGIQGRIVEAARRLGVRHIVLTAGRDDSTDPEERQVGYKVWPIFGYDAPIPQDRRPLLPPDLATASTILDLYETDAGRRWWEENGKPIRDMVFDTRPGSRSSRVWAAYLRTKNLARLRSRLADPPA